MSESLPVVGCSRHYWDQRRLVPKTNLYRSEAKRSAFSHVYRLNDSALGTQDFPGRPISSRPSSLRMQSQLDPTVQLFGAQTLSFHQFPGPRKQPGTAVVLLFLFVVCMCGITFLVFALGASFS